MSTYLLQAKSRSKTAQYLAHDGTLTPEVAHAATSWGLDDAMKVIHFAKLFGKDGLEQLVHRWHSARFGCLPHARRGPDCFRSSTRTPIVGMTKRMQHLP